MKTKYVLVLLSIHLSVCYRLQQNNRQESLTVEYEWKSLDFVFPDDRSRKEAIATGLYNPTKVIPLDVDVWEKDGKEKVFVAMPDHFGVRVVNISGNPCVLATVEDAELGQKSPRLVPYPNWSWHRKASCDSISSVFRIAIDERDRLWVLDTGDFAACGPQLLTFSLISDRLLSRYRFPKSVLKDNSQLILPVVDERPGSTFVYIADVMSRGLIVYHHETQRSWRVEHPSFFPDMSWINFSVAGTNFTLEDGLYGLALGPVRAGDRPLYFHALASVKEGVVNTSLLRNPDNFVNGINAVKDKFHIFDYSRPTQSAAQAMTPDGVLFSSLLGELSMSCWNSLRKFSKQNIQVIAPDPETLQYVSGAKVRDGELWVISNRVQRLMAGTMNWTEVNFRILKGNVRKLLWGTNCDSRIWS